MAGRTRHLFGRGNTARGVHCLYDSAMGGLNRLYRLSGFPGTGKSTLIRRIADQASARGETVELFHSPFNPDDLDGLIIKGLQVGIADERACRVLDAVRAEQVRIDLGPAVDRQRLETEHEVETLHTQSRAATALAYETFATALRIHDEWEALYIAQMDFQKANQIGQELAYAFYGPQARPKPASVRHLFFGAATPRGAVDHIATLTADLERRILIKGRPGSGKSTLLKRLAAAAEAKGVDVEVFHCGFDPHSLDMLIFPELSLAIFDSTAPHEYAPSLSHDEVLDMYELVIEPGTDERFATEVQAIQGRYAAKMKEATAHLREAQALHQRMRAHYTACTDFAQVDQISHQLQAEIERLAAARSQG